MTAHNYFILEIRSRKTPEDSNDLTMLKIWQRYVLLQLIPCFIAGAGVMTGNVDGFINFVMPHQGETSIALWYGSIVAIWLVAGYWLFFCDGASKYCKGSGNRQVTRLKVYGLKILWSIGLIFQSSVYFALKFLK